MAVKASCCQVRPCMEGERNAPSGKCMPGLAICTKRQPMAEVSTNSLAASSNDWCVYIGPSTKVSLGCAVSGGFYAKTAGAQLNFLVFS